MGARRSRADAQHAALQAAALSSATCRTFRYAELQQVAPRAQWLLVAGPLSADTRHPVDAALLQRLPPGAIVWALPNTMVTPHAAGHAAGNAERVAAIFIDNVGRWLRGAPLHNRAWAYPAPERLVQCSTLCGT